MATINTKGYESLLNPGTTSSTTTKTEEKTGSSDVLGKDDFLKLLLVELQYQDPTSPMDTEKILTQTSQLATLEASTNTTTALTELAEQLSSSTNLNAVSAIGKMASLGSSAVSLSSGNTDFEVYFPTKITDGTMTIKNSSGTTVKTIDLGDAAAGKSGVIAFNWDGIDNSGTQLKDGLYSVTATYTDANGDSKTTQSGVYPVESVRYQDGSTYLKLGSNYYAMSDVVEIYDKSLI